MTTIDRRRSIDDLVTHRQTIAGDVRLHYVEAGPADGDLVVCLHGFPEFWYSWRRQIPALVEAGYRVVAPDMRGYNRSEKPRGVDAYRLEELVGDVYALIGALGAETAHVVGHDWGGVVAWAVGYTAPDVVDRLVVMNAPHPIKYARELSIEQFARSWYALFFQIPWLPERLFAARNFAALEGALQDGSIAPEAFTDADVERYKTAFQRPGALTSAIDYYRALFRHITFDELPGRVPLVGDRFVDAVPPVTAPTLVLWGERDAALSIEQTEGLDRYAEDVSVVRFPDASHWVNADRPEAVNGALLEFFERSTRGRRGK